METVIDKAKVTIFGNRKAKTDNYRFIYDNKHLEIVDTYKYLGVLFKYNGKFNDHKKLLKAQANKAMFSLLNKSRRLHLIYQ